MGMIYPKPVIWSMVLLKYTLWFKECHTVAVE